MFKIIMTVSTITTDPASNYQYDIYFLRKKLLKFITLYIKDTRHSVGFGKWKTTTKYFTSQAINILKYF